MATSTSKSFNDAIRGSLIDQTNGTLSQQISPVSSATTLSGVESNVDLNDAVRGALIDQTDTTIAKQVRFV